MKPISYISEQDRDYTQALGKVTTLAELRALTAEYGELCADAKAIADAMTEADFIEYAAGTKKERRGKFAGEAFAEKYGAVHMPEVIFRASVVALKYHVPWGLAYLRLKEAEQAKA